MQDHLALDAFQVVGEVVDVRQVWQGAFAPVVAFCQAQVIRPDLSVFAERMRAFQHVFQFADIARKTVALECLQCLRLQVSDRQAALRRQAFEHVSGQ
ncbi:hypothetical protein D3C85_916180 [compost metagenome]